MTSAHPATRGVLLAVLLACGLCRPAACWPLPEMDIVKTQWQDELLGHLWGDHKDQLSFCVGAKLSDAQALMAASFPAVLPSGPADDALCSNSSLIMAHLCSPQELQFYMKYLLLTSDLEKLPSNRWCDVSSHTAACAPGFFQPRIPQLPPALGQDTKLQDKEQPHACCPGYICPSMLTCIIPCPSGAWCPRAWPADPPVNYLSAADTPQGVEPSLLPAGLVPQQQHEAPSDKWCAPYAYKMRPELGCGGADKWSIEPMEPFPRRWDWWSGSIYCSGGRFCPNTTSMLDCQAGHFCKSGSSTMTPCPPLLGCPANTESPTDNWLGFALDGALFLLLALMWQVSRLYNQLMRRLSSKERMRVMWNSRTNAPEIAVVEEDEPAAPPPTARHTTAGAYSHSTAGALTSAVMPAVPAQGAGRLSPSSWLALPARFGFLSRAQLARRRSSRAGSAAGAGGAAELPWASLVDEAEGVQYSVPLLQCDMQAQAEEVSNSQHHSRQAAVTLGSLGPSGPVVQQALSSIKAKKGRPSSDAGQDLIAAGIYTALSPASLRQRLDLEASSGPFRFQRSASEAGDDGSWGPYALHADSPAGRGQLGAVIRPLLLDVGFAGLGLKLKSCGKVVLQGVSGRLEHGRLAAVMGPSGAGKTTLLTALAGRASYGTITGKVTINGRPDRLEKHKRLMGFVPQSDIMYRTLTVEENLTYSACFRLPASTTPRQRLQVVASAIDVLGLDDVRHSLIGNEEVRGISGGQVKRVNVGLELVAEPSLLFLDEPTSGLDSTASKLVVQCLQRVARTGVTVAAVIHQPSWETFSLFDDLILLAKGGLTAFYGPQVNVQSYFEGLGFQIPDHMNPADAYLDIIAGAIMPTSGSALDIAACWSQSHSHSHSTSNHINHCNTDDHRNSNAFLTQNSGQGAAVVAIAASRRSSEQGMHDEACRQPWAALLKLPQAVLLGLTLLASATSDTINGIRNAAAEQLQCWASVIAARDSPLIQHGVTVPTMQQQSGADRQPPGFCRQYSLVLQRAVLMRTREPLLVTIEYMIFAITGMFVGLMSDRGRGSIGSYVGNVVYSIVAMGMLSTISGIKVFGGPDRLVFYREASTGLSKLAYFWALDLWSYVGMVLRCAVYLVMYYTYSQPRAVVWQLYVVTCAIYYSCQGQAFLLSQIMGPNAAQLTAAVSALINALVASKFSTQGALGLMNTISYARWGLEGYVIAEANCLKGVWLLARCADLAAFSYDVTRFSYAIKVLLYIGIGSRLAACTAMLTLHRDKSL